MNLNNSVKNGLSKIFFLVVKVIVLKNSFLEQCFDQHDLPGSVRVFRLSFSFFSLEIMLREEDKVRKKTRLIFLVETFTQYCHYLQTIYCIPFSYPI